MSDPMKRILLTIAYDGTNYNGWQKQLSPPIPTVEGQLEKGLRKLFKDPNLTLIGASRTDKGVHAHGQRATIDVATTMPAEKIPMAILGFIPSDIVIVHAEEVPMTFHPRYHCVNKTYEYHILNQKFRDPLKRLYGTFIYGDFDVEKMNEAAKKFVGKKDFKGFCTDGNEMENTVREIFRCHVERVDHEIVISVTGDGFLYHMVRTIAGTLIGVGKGKMELSRIDEIFQTRDRQKAWYTAEAQALVLKEITYDMI